MKSAELLSRIWSEKGLSAMLVFLCLALFVGAPLLAAGKIGEAFFDVVFSLLLVSGVVAIAQRPLLSLAAGLLTLATIALRTVSFARPDSGARLWSDALSILLLATLAALVLKQVLRQGPVTAYRIQGAIVVYLLMGLTWSAAYELAQALLPGAFQFASGGPDAARATHGLVYFSFVTLTTTGYGDVTPAHPVTRSLAIAEALTGQLYLAILIARLVSLRISSREGR